MLKRFTFHPPEAVDSRIRRGRHGGTGSTGSRAVAVAMGLYSSVHAVYN